MKTIEDLRRDAGNDLCSLLERIFPENRAIEWFYTREIPDLGGTPAQAKEHHGSGAVIEYFVTKVASFAGGYEAVFE